MINQTHPNLFKAGNSESPSAWSMAGVTGKLPDFIHLGRAICGISAKQSDGNNGWPTAWVPMQSVPWTVHWHGATLVTAPAKPSLGRQVVVRAQFLGKPRG